MDKYKLPPNDPRFLDTDLREQLTDYFEDLILQRDALKTVDASVFDEKIRDEIERLEDILEQRTPTTRAKTRKSGSPDYGSATLTGDPITDAIELACENGDDELALKLLKEWEADGR